MGRLGEIRERSGLKPFELLRGPTVLRQTNLECSIGHQVSSDSVEPGIGIARSNPSSGGRAGEEQLEFPLREHLRREGI